MKEKKIVICDIDGTIANNDHRQHFLKKKKDWDGFFSKLHKDEPIFEIIDKVKALEKEGRRIIFLTGRPEKYRQQTEDWLKKYFTFDLEILMRKDNDRRNKIEIKKELFETHLSSLEIKVIFENDPELIFLWKKLGFIVFEVNV
tara:strand:- start:5118 stop:5549 length:432 start_codon:yes stop_codon:yes gene_type:complete